MVNIYRYNDYYSPTYISISSGDWRHVGSFSYNKKETKEEKILRISREKMFASWKLHNDHYLNKIEIKQICKPRHLMGLRHLH
jgi:Tol biopolymer transport system component